MKMTEIRALEPGDLQIQLDKLRRELFTMRVKASTENLDNPARIGQMRRDLARILTEKRQRERNEGSGS
jgi:large subunit ribosomal protein L29